MVWLAVWPVLAVIVSFEPLDEGAEGAAVKAVVMESDEADEADGIASLSTVAVDSIEMTEQKTLWRVSGDLWCSLNRCDMELRYFDAQLLHNSQLLSDLYVRNNGKLRLIKR